MVKPFFFHIILSSFLKTSITCFDVRAVDIRGENRKFSALSFVRESEGILPKNVKNILKQNKTKQNVLAVFLRF